MSFLSLSGFNNLVPLYNSDTRTIVFIDSGIIYCEVLAQQIVPEARVIILGSDEDGITEISRTLRNSHCQKIYILASGFPGCIYLGNSELSLSTLHQYTSQLNHWFAKYNASDFGDRQSYIGIYGFNLAAGDVGEEFLLKLNKLTGAKIATGVNLAESNVLTVNS